MAFTLTVSSSKIDVSAGTGTLSELYADAIAVDASCMTNPSANVYQVEGNRELEMSNATLTVETGDTLQTNRTSNGTFLDIQSNAKIIFEAGSTKIDDTNGTHMSYNYFYGGLDVQGTSGNPVVWDLTGRNLMYPYGLNSLAHTVEYLTIQDPVSNSSYCMTFYPAVYTMTDIEHTYDNIICKAGPTENLNNAWLILFNPGSYHNFTFTNIDLQDGDGYLSYACTNLVIDGGTQTSSAIDNRFFAAASGLGAAGYLNTGRDDSNGKLFANVNQNQNKFVFKNYTFDNNDAGVYVGGTLARQGVMYFESCTFQNGTYAFNVDAGHVVLYNCTFTSITTNFAYNATRNGTVLYARKITLTVEDSLGAPIADATVTFRQKEGREAWTCRTDSNGAVLDGKGEPIWLIEREERTIGNFTEWSDGVGDRVHVIEVNKTGYEPHTQEIAMTADRTVAVVLDDAGTIQVRGTTLNNATINNATIY